MAAKAGRSALLITKRSAISIKPAVLAFNESVNGARQARISRAFGRPGERAAGLLDFLIQRMAYFMVPRYIRILDELPKTPSAKVQKHLLRREAVTADTWDCEAEGRCVRREALGA